MEHICIKCHNNSQSHSFSLLCNFNYNNKVNHLFYTKPSNAILYNDTEGVLLHYENYLNYINPESWYWVVDFDKFEFKHSLEISTVIGLSKLIARFGKVNGIIIINQSKYFKYLLQIARPFIKNIYTKLIMFDKTDKEKLKEYLENLNIDKTYIDFLINC